MRALAAATAALLLITTGCPSDPDPTPGRDASVRDPTDATVNADGTTNADATTAGDAGYADAGNVDAGGLDASIADTGQPWQWPVDTTTIAITPSRFWKTRITPDDVFRNEAPRNTDEPRWVKFSVLVGDPRQAYFQDSRQYPFHYDFATAHLDPFVGMSRRDIDRISLHEADQAVIFGAVIFAPSTHGRELGIQLVRQDAYHPEMVRRVFELVASSIETAQPWRTFYFPTFEQSASARQHSSFFAQHDIEVSSSARWAGGHECYAPGWALGRLRTIAATEIDAAYADGRLDHTDILVTDGVPAEVPLVAGILTTAPSTPSSHVAILAATYGVPFAFVAIEPERSQLAALEGKLVALNAARSWEASCQLRLLDMDRLDPSLEAAILDIKAPAELTITPKATRGALSAGTDGLQPSDIQHFGGKATNYAVVRTAVPGQSRPAIALSFDLWDGFMAQSLGTGGTLGDRIQSIIATHQWPANIAMLRADLAMVRDLIRDTAIFDGAQRAEVIAALAAFDPQRKLRFRSSTNVEDSDAFTGAGLYSSYSGCLADDTDGDEIGPSICNASKPNERGVFRALRKVYASFYNDNAFIERLRHGVDERQVGMAVLVHHSFPDALEQANGVAELSWRQTSISMKLVSQPGATSVTNPTGDAIPEVVEVLGFGSSWYPTLVGRSSLVPLGGYVLEWPDGYNALAGHLKAVADRFASVHQIGTRLVLDAEYKKMDGEGLLIKQIRKIPQPSTVDSVTTYLLDRPTERCTFQGEYGDVLATHRVKSRWSIGTRNTALDDASIASTYLRQIDVTYLANSGPVTAMGDPTTWTAFAHSVMNDRVADEWRFDDRTFSLQAELVRLVRPSWNPLYVLDDVFTTVKVTYPRPIPSLDWNNMPTTTTEETIRLGRCPETNVVSAATPLREHRVDLGSGRELHIRHWWPAPPPGAAAGNTAPLPKGGEPRLTGVTSQPIVMRGYWSQTYRPGHHNFSESYIFEPQLEERIDPAILTELEAANIRLLVVTVGDAQPVVRVLGTDGRFRPWR